MNESRFQLFSAMNRQIDNIPSTAASLVKHTRRDVLQANIWHQIYRKETNKLDPESFGWRVIEGNWKPHWSDLPEVSSICRELIKCGCRQCKPTSCKCRQEDHVLFFVNVVETVEHLLTLSSTGGDFLPPSGFSSASPRVINRGH